LAKPLIIVESPAKARTIGKFLGRDYVVESSIGHIRDLPSSADEIPAQYKKKSWARTGVDVENGFTPLYIVPATKRQQVKKLKDLLDDASELYLATDEDREGEAIAWHLKEVLNPKVPVKRMVFHEITEKAIKEALAHPRALDTRLVDAQEARRILDRLYGYEVSPVLWKKVRPRLSAGRVQSVATRLIVERERARMAFKSGDYWSVQAVLDNRSGKPESVVAANLVDLSGQRLAVGRDFNPDTGSLSDAAKKSGVLLLGETGARALESGLKGKDVVVDDVQKRPFTEKPAPPFTTSTLQQEAGRKLRYTAQRAMRIAQRLYENGYITYMRTDSTNLSDEAIGAAREQIVALYGKENLPDSKRVYPTKAKGAQEAHEAIRPAGSAFRTPESIRDELDDDAFKLYDLIWKRTVACQMKDATGEKTAVRFSVALTDDMVKACGVKPGKATFTVSGKVILFPGFLRAYVEGSDDPDAEIEEKERVLPPMKEGETLLVKNLEGKKSETQPPARYTEASLVKDLEDRGIGRPSTYASIIQTVQDRGYVFKKGGALVPTLTAFAVVALLEQHFKELVDYAFTAKMEDDLDSISSGERESGPWLELFYFGKDRKDDAPKKGPLEIVGLKSLIGSSVEDIDPRAVCTTEIGVTKNGEIICARVGRYGPYLQIGDSDKRANLPEDMPPDELDVEKALSLIRQVEIANRKLGAHPTTGDTVYLKSGRFGPYVQQGDPELTAKGAIKKGTKPRMASVWKGFPIETLGLDDAVLFLSYPKVLGQHPDTGADVIATDGQFGPYIVTEHDGKKDSRSLEGQQDLLSINLERALALLAQPKERGRQKREGSGALKVLEPSPVTGKNLEIKTGKFGPYVTDGVVNATIPSTRDPQSISFDEALELIATREERMRAQGKDPRPVKKAPGAPKAPAAAKTAKPAAVSTKAPKAAEKAPAKKASPTTKKAPVKKAASTKAAAKAPEAKKPAAKPTTKVRKR
jgi:DNA topoisomerase-1